MRPTSRVFRTVGVITAATSGSGGAPGAGRGPPPSRRPAEAPTGMGTARPTSIEVIGVAVGTPSAMRPARASGPSSPVTRRATPCGGARTPMGVAIATRALGIGQGGGSSMLIVPTPLAGGPAGPAIGRRGTRGRSAGPEAASRRPVAYGLRLRITASCGPSIPAGRSSCRSATSATSSAPTRTAR